MRRTLFGAVLYSALYKERRLFSQVQAFLFFFLPPFWISASLELRA